MKKNVRSGKEYNNDWPIVAICYDFDKTLSPKDMQNFELIPKLKCKVGPFWKEATKLAKENGMDKIIAYMKLIVDKAKAKKEKLTRNDFNNLGKGIELFPGVETWFSRINEIGKAYQLNIEHYIISAGLKEIIDGTSIRNEFEGVYASEFCYDEYDAPCWPAQVVNYTSKTQYLFRISKDCLDLSDEESVNEYISDRDRRIPFKHFIYIGDSETDIPAMRIVKQGGGYSIGVYNPISCNLDKVSRLLQQERIDFLMPADYSEGSKIENALKIILKKIKSNHEINELNNQQKAFVNDMETADVFIEYTKDYLSQSDITLDNLKSLEKQGNRILKGIQKDILHDHSEVVGQNEIEAAIKVKQKLLAETFNEKRKKLEKKKINNNKKQNDNNI